MASKLDIIIFAASGFTGKYVLMQAHKLFKNITWGIAGRNENKLKHTLQETGKAAGVEDIGYIPIIYADIEDEQTIKKMTNQAKVIINCCGPCELFGGELIVKCCVESGTHYIDVSAEEIFINSITSKYGKLAEEKGIYIVNLCGFDSLPFDLGVCYIEQKFEGILNSMEIYIHMTKEKDIKSGSSINYTTWKSLVNSLSKYKKMKTMRKEHNQTKRNVEVKPKLFTKLPHKYENVLALPYPGADEDTIRRSQLYFYENFNKRPIQVRNYIILESFYALLVTIVLGLLCFIFSQFAFGRSLLLKYPEFFSNGTFSHEEPSEEVLSKRNFVLTFKGKGWKNKNSKIDMLSRILPNKEIVARVSGNNPAYGFTGLAVVLSGLIVLKEQNNLPAKGGIYTPGVAFNKTSMVEQLQKYGVNFEVISTSDL